MVGKSRPLGNHTLINTSEVSKTEEFLQGALRGSIKALSRQHSQLNLQANRFQLANSEIWYCIYGAPLTVEFPEGDYFRIQFHVNGQGRTRVGRQEFAVTPTQSVISSPTAQINFGPDFEQTVLRISKASLTKKITALTGITLAHPLEFAETFNPEAPQHLILKKNFDFLMHAINSEDAVVPSLVLHEMEQVLITSFLSCCPHNYSNLLQRQEAAAAPWQVCMIEEYIEANWNKPIKMSDILAVSGCSARSIFRAFQRSRGYSPLTFAKNVRMRHARKMLIEQPGINVTSAALNCGFLDLGRFSRDYAKAFGELPSHTLRHKKHIKLPL